MNPLAGQSRVYLTAFSILGVLLMERILFVCLALSNGGAERVVSVLSDSLINNGYEIYILPLTDREQTYAINENIHILKPDRTKAGAIGKIYRILGIRKAIKQHKINTVIAFSHYNAMYSVLAAKGLSCRVIGSERNDPAQLDSRKALNWLRFKLYKKLDALVCQTNDAKDYFPGEIREKTVVILNPVSDTLPEPYPGERARRVVSFSRLEPQKNIPMLIDAFEIFHKSHSDFVMDIYGDGSQRDKLIGLAEERGLGNRIHFHSFTTDIHNAVLDAAMFALSSDYEGLSNSMIEAMGCGIPTIVTDCPCGGARMVIEDGVNGLLVPVGDSRKMAEAMARVADDRELADRLSKNGTMIRKKLDKREIAEQWKKVLKG